MKNDLQKRADFYTKRFGFVPSFKAGMHLGNVTTGEIGALKKETFFTGDVLNVTARIQSLCSNYGVDLLLSAEHAEKMRLGSALIAKPLGSSVLKGRSAPTELVAILDASHGQPTAWFITYFYRHIIIIL